MGKFFGNLITKLGEIGIETRPIFIPIHTLPPYSEYRELIMPSTVTISRSGISLPTSSLMSESEIAFIGHTFLEELKKLSR